MIVPEFQRFSQEGTLVGRLVVGYGSLESALSSCVAMARDDLDMVLKTMFRTRGETQRIEIADAIGRPSYRALGMETVFSEAIGDLRYCLKIRNQYAHCQWHDDLTGRLCFVDMEEIATPHKIIQDLRGLTFHYLTVELLADQESFFVYVGACLLYLNFEGRRKAGKISTPRHAKPKKAIRPPLHIP